MIPIIEKYQPDLWVYGHTHFDDDRKLGATRIISNPAGYKNYREVYGFDPNGKIHYVANV
jgi:Icc-related predicted phosphoesterase